MNRLEEEALASYAQALALEPGHVEAHYNQGLALAILAPPSGDIPASSPELARGRRAHLKQRSPRSALPCWGVRRHLRAPHRLPWMNLRLFLGAGYQKELDVGWI